MWSVYDCVSRVPTQSHGCHKSSRLANTRWSVCSDAHPHRNSHGYFDQHADSDANGYGHVNHDADTDPNNDAYTDSHAHKHSDAHKHIHQHSDAHIYGDGQSNAISHAYDDRVHNIYTYHADL